MKRILLVSMLFSCAIMLISAQDMHRRRHPGGAPHNPQCQNWSKGYGNHQNFQQQPEKVSINGNLTIVRGMIAVKSNDLTYLAGGLTRFIGFIDGLKDGAAVILDGNAFSLPQNDKVKFLQVQKMTLNGKEYDLGRLRQNTAPDQMQNMRPPMYQQHGHNRQGCPCMQQQDHHRRK